MNSEDFIEFFENLFGVKLVEWQKDYLKAIYEKKKKEKEENED